MDPPLVGALCSYAYCHSHDFLPTKCISCDNLYCGDHYFLDAHNCEALAATCALEGCISPSLESYAGRDVGEVARVPATCSRCSLSFCIQHRFPDAHSCAGALAPPGDSSNSKREAALAVLAKNFPLKDKEEKIAGSSTLHNRTKKRQTSQQARIVQFMKIRQSATPGDPKSGHADLRDRLHVRVKAEKSDAYKVFWFRKSISTGRAFDLIQQRLQTSSQKPWGLLKESDESDEPPTLITKFDSPLSEEIEDGCKLLLIPSE